MIKSIAVWFVKAISLLILTILAFPLAPLFSLFIIYAEESDITGFPSMFPGKSREFLIAPLRIWQSPDAPLDEFWYGDYQGWPKNGKSQSDYDNSWWLRYTCRIAWLWRNAAYGFGAKFGYACTERFDDGPLWRTWTNCSYFWKTINATGDIGWCWKAQFFYTSTRCVEVYLGYKLMGDSIQGKKFVAMQINPIRQYAR